MPSYITLGERAFYATMSSFLKMLIAMREEAVKQQLTVHVKNLNRLELQEAQHGLDVPMKLSNEIEYTLEKIYHLARELQRQEGLLSELGALHRRL